MMENKDIVVVGIQPWDIPIGSNCKDIATQFAQGNRVLYVNNPISYIDFIKDPDSEKTKNRKDAIKYPENALYQESKNLWVYTPPVKTYPINFVNHDGLFKVLNKVNNKKFAEAIKKAVARLNFKDFILFNDQNMFLGYYLKEHLRPEKYIYYVRDNLLNVPYWKKHGHKVEPKLISKADMVFTNSLLYEENARRYNEKSFMVGQGCDTEMYQANMVAKAEELMGIEKPIIGYVGFLSSKRLDIEIIEHIAISRPDYEVVLVGPEDDSFQRSNLHQLANVRFLGPKPPETLPAYIKGFDVAINPQRLTKATMGNYPRKIDEYLAMGKPTVATRTKAMAYFGDVVFLAKDKEEYVAMIAKALASDSEEKQQERIAVGHAHSWANCVATMYNHLQNN
ncbi:glycosyltransferase [Croceitalea dokdonensis]|nr:glycosyltransferase [Croceitalea dokdonensis]